MATTTTPTSLITWKLDPAHSHAEFKVRHMMISNVKGVSPPSRNLDGKHD